MQQTTIKSFAAFFKNNKKGKFHENRLTDDSHLVPGLIFFSKIMKD